MVTANVDVTYPGGFRALEKQADKRVQHFIGAEDFFIELGDDLDAMETKIVTRTEAERYKLLTVWDKMLELEDEFEGRSYLLLVHALTIAVLRRENPPPQAAILFQKMWANKSDTLLEALNTRWIISALTTFADHGVNEAQRRLGTSMTIMMGMIKFYEAERSLTGLPLHRPSRRDRKTKDGSKTQKLGMGMERYSLLKGDVDRNVLLRLWADTKSDEVIAAPARHLLERLNADRKNAFRRMMLLRERKRVELEKSLARRKAEGLIDPDP